ncbi:MAG TPA: alpha/beta hydrolase [Pseudonocardiaceae bacterium]|jgi:3-oxoadipate enol-lactonase|nr:alpha/beta hydrolase [Pseudonocardiaceae bacterium]
MPEIIANGVRLHVQRLTPSHRSRTPAQPVVFIHGLGMDNMSSYYYTLANPVAQTGAEVIMYDLRGHGLSERPQAGYGVADSVADLAALLDALEVDGPVHLVGNSYGGTVALGFAVTYPHRVASMVLIEAHFTVAGWAEQVAAERDRIGSDAAGGDLRSWLEQLGRKVTRLLAMADDLINRTTFLDDLKAVQPIPMSRLRTLTCPVRAIYGEHSDVVDYARELDAYLPHCELTVLAGCGHSVLMDATAALREIVLDWLAIQASVITP